MAKLIQVPCKCECKLHTVRRGKSDLSKKSWIGQWGRRSWFVCHMTKTRYSCSSLSSLADNIFFLFSGQFSKDILSFIMSLWCLLFFTCRWLPFSTKASKHLMFCRCPFFGFVPLSWLKLLTKRLCTCFLNFLWTMASAFGWKTRWRQVNPTEADSIFI